MLTDDHEQGECFRIKKSGHKILVTLLSVFLAISVMLNVASAASLVEITAYLNNEIKIMLNGKPFEPKLADGTKVVPIAYNGTTCLPLRAISEAVGLETTKYGNYKSSPPVIEFKEESSQLLLKRSRQKMPTKVGIFRHNPPLRIGANRL